MSNVSMREMLEAGVHFGHQTRFWNPKMAPFIFGERNKIHIINLEKTMPLFNEAMDYLGSTAARRGKVLFVGTKRAARNSVQEFAEQCGMPYVNHRWLGGMLTNFRTVKQSIRRLKELEEKLSATASEKRSKKELLQMQREMDKLQKTLGGIKDMNSLPQALFVIDVGFEKIAVNEATKLGIPVVGVVDTNNSMNDLEYVIPGNDDSMRAIHLYAKAACEAIENGKATIVTGGSDGDELIELDADGSVVDAKAAPAKKAAKKAAVKKASVKKAAVKEEAPAAEASEAGE